MSNHTISTLAWERMVSAVEKVRERMRRAVAALEQANVPYALAGGNAIAAWVSEVDEAAVRNTQDVDILLRRADLDCARAALEGAGFVYKHSSGLDMFLDGPKAKAEMPFASCSLEKKFGPIIPKLRLSSRSLALRHPATC